MPDRQPAQSERTRTIEISVVGANCPWCFNETIDVLRQEPGVVSVNASMAGQCMTIEHRDVGTDRLVELVRGHLRADVTSSADHVMVAVDPRVAELHCTHRHRAEQQGTS